MGGSTGRRGLAVVLLASAAPLPLAAQPGRSPVGPPAELVGMTWQWVELTTPAEQIQVAEPERYEIEILQAGRLGVRADCNRGSAPLTFGPDRQLTVGPMAMTRALCPAGSLSDRFAWAVSQARAYRIQTGELFLELGPEAGTLRFQRRL